MFKEGLLEGKRILITGGGTGLGREIAARYLQLGAEVWIAARRGPVLEATAQELMKAHGGKVRTHAVDIRDAQAVDAMVQRIWDEAGLHVMTKSLAVEWGRYGIRLNAIAPGPFPTEGASKRLRPDGRFEDGNERNPMRRVGQMPELQNLATFLMADGCEWLTGETMALDGAGYLANGGAFAELDKLSDADWERMRAKIKAQNEKDRAGRLQDRTGRVQDRTERVQDRTERGA